MRAQYWMLKKGCIACLLTLGLTAVCLADTKEFGWSSPSPPIKIVGSYAEELNHTVLKSVRLDDVPALNAFHQVLKAINKLRPRNKPFRLAVDIQIFDEAAKLQPVTISLSDVDAITALKFVTTSTDTTFRVYDDLIVIIPANPQPKLPKKRDSEEYSD